MIAEDESIDRSHKRGTHRVARRRDGQRCHVRIGGAGVRRASRVRSWPRPAQRPPSTSQPPAQQRFRAEWDFEAITEADKAIDAKRILDAGIAACGAHLAKPGVDFGAVADVVTVRTATGQRRWPRCWSLTEYPASELRLALRG